MLKERLENLSPEFSRQEELSDLFPSGIPLEDLFEFQLLMDFREEGEVHLQGVEARLLDLESKPCTKEQINALFRLFHSIKGNAALLISAAKRPLPPCHPLHFLRAVAHGGESILSRFRRQENPVIDDETIETLLGCLDTFRQLRREFFSCSAQAIVAPELLAKFSIKLDQFCQTDLNILEDCIHILETKGEPDRQTVLIFLGGLKNMKCACGRLNRMDIHEDIVQQQKLLEEWLEQPAKPFMAVFDELKRLFQKLVERIKKPQPQTVDPKPAEREKPSETVAEPTPGKSSLRVDEEKIDQLMRVAGELFAARGAFPALARKTALLPGGGDTAQELKEAGGVVSRLVEDLRSVIMSIRMLPLKTVFQRCPRLVRDLARTLGKEVQLTISGENTEMDKTMLEQLGDPLVHIIRNAVDHGIELPEIRVKKGKPGQGLIHLSGGIEGNLAVIRISDDGKGLDPEVLRRKAVEKRLLSAEAAARLTDQEACELIFAAGFSTAEKVTDVSGRGVGMDVVRNNVRLLQGSVKIDSKVGQGSVFILHLPTSLLVSQALLIEAAGEPYLFPLESLISLEKVSHNAIHTYQSQTFVSIRGNVLSFIDLGRLLGKRGTGENRVPGRDDQRQEIPLAVVKTLAGPIALGIDAFLGEEDILIKPLGPEFKEQRFLAGASILGDGRVVLVLNPLEFATLLRRPEAMASVA
jgi:chemotaxis protein histidine kinase CheA